MRKSIISLVAILLVTVLSLPVMAYAEADDEGTVGLFINEKWISAEAPPILKNDRTLAPLRLIAEALNFEVGWEEREQKVTVSKNNISFDLFINQNYIIKDGQKIATDIAPILWFDTTIVPVRLISELLSCDVEWDGNHYMVFVDSPKHYAYYKNNPPVYKTYYENETVTLTGHIEKMLYFSEAYSKTEPVKEVHHFIADDRATYVYAGLSVVPIPHENIKRLEIMSFDGSIDFEQYIGKRVTVTGKAMPPAASWATADARIYATSIKLSEID